MNYFLAVLYQPIRIGFVSLTALCILVALKGLRVIRMRNSVMGLLVLLVFSLMLGVAFVPDLGFGRMVQAFGVAIYFLCGYVFFRWVTDPKLVVRVLAFVGALYAAVCVAALLQLYPAYFPVIDSFVLKNGEIVSRPEVMTDQNFQMFYLIPIAVGFLIARGSLRILGFVVLLICSAYILARLGTRSGSLVFAGILMLGLFACYKNPDLGSRKMWALPLAIVTLLVVALPVVIEQLALLLFRFSETGQQGAVGRLVGTTYALEKMLNPAWWIPRGTSDFRNTFTGHLPHSNIGGIFLDAGILGLVAWALLVPVPVIKLGRKLYRGGMDAIAAGVACGATGALVLQLSLYAVTDSQVWLWAGAAVGVLERLRMSARISIPYESPVTNAMDAPVLRRG